MKRIGKIVIEYTKEELATILQNAIAVAEKVSIEGMEFKDDRFIFHCVEGINTLVQKDQITKINFGSFVPSETSNSRILGISKALKEILANGVVCPLDQIVKEMELRGFKKPVSYYRNGLKNVYKDFFIEVNPDIFQLRKFFNKEHQTVKE